MLAEMKVYQFTLVKFTPTKHEQKSRVVTGILGKEPHPTHNNRIPIFNQHSLELKKRRTKKTGPENFGTSDSSR